MAYTDGNGTQFSDDRKRLIKFTSDFSDYSIPSGTEEIAANAFKDKKSLKVLHLPSSIKKVEGGAFSNCSIDEIHFAGDIEQWLQITWKCFFSKGYRLYFNNTDLVESIIIPESISIIKEKAFYYCSSLQSVIFNKNITSIERDAFNKSGLRGILSIPKSCKTIKQYAFFNCTGITKVKIPESTESIWFGAFSACYGLKSFVVSTGNDNFFTDGVGLYAFEKEKDTKVINKEKLNLVALASGSKNKYRIHEHTISIYSDACCFSSIPGGELEIPQVVSVIKDAFRKCSGCVKAPIELRKTIFSEGITEKKFKTIFNYQEALTTTEIPEVLSQNPFRVLGVYCNASQREIQSNAARIKRFLEIGKQPTFKSDFNEVLPPLERTQEMVDRALSQISQPKEKLAYAMLWFAKPCCEQHHKVEDLLRNNKADEACELIIHNCGDIRTMLGPYVSLSRQRTNSDFSLISLVHIVHSICSEKEYTDNNGQLIKLDKSLIEEICGDNFVISEDECQTLLFDKLMTFVNPIHLWACTNRPYFSESVIEHLFSMSIGKNIANINTQIVATKAVDKKDSPKNLKAAKALRRKTEQDIAFVDEYLSPSDVRYISIHDALSEQILQSAIDSYNNAESRYSVARDVYELMQYASTLAKSDLVKNRCADNLKTVKEIVDDLPPESLEAADKELFAAVTRARNSSDTIDQAIALLKEAEPHLFKINLKKLTEKDDSKAKHVLAYFTKVSTVIANVCLNKLIEDVNSSRSDKSYEAWKIITALNQLPLDEEFKKKRYNENVDILIKNLASGLFGIRHSRNEVSYNLIDLRPEATVWQDCVNKNNFRQYIKRFPKGAHIKEAKEKQNAIDRENEERRRRQEEQREIERKRREEERIKEQKIKREGKLLNWAIGILVVFIAFELIYAFWGWDGVLGTLGIIGALAFMALIGWARDSISS